MSEGKESPSCILVHLTLPNGRVLSMELVSEDPISIGGQKSRASLQVEELPPTCSLLLSASADDVELSAASPNTELYNPDDSSRVERLKGATEVAGVIGPVGQRIVVKRGLTTRFGNYLLTGRIGGGGMAEVYAARQIGLGGFNRKVALKLIQPQVLTVPNARQMFFDEARIAAEVNHHNTAKIIELGEQDGTLFLAMEYIPGVPLNDLVDQFHARGEHVPLDLIAALVAQACAGLHALHELRDPAGRLRNVVHRDVSPNNMMLTPEGLIKVIDFGLAREYLQERTSGRILKGKPSYMSPEQIASKPLDRRADVFALGVILFQFLSGVSPFSREGIAPTLFAVINEQPPPLRGLRADVTARLERVTYAALEKDREMRPPSTAALAAELQRAVMELGGRFLSPESIASFLTQHGMQLRAPAPELFTKIPTALLAKSKPEPAAKRDPVLMAPGRLVGTAITDSPYTLVRYLGPKKEAGAELYKLLFLAQIAEDKVQAKPVDVTRPGDHNTVVLALCGQGTSLAPLSATQQARLEGYCAKRHRSVCLPYLIPILHIGSAWKDGPTYVAMPTAGTRLLPDSPKLPAQAQERLPIVEALWTALGRAQEEIPGFVHGDIKPENLALREGSEADVCFLDFSLENALGLPARVPTQAPLYVAPECASGQPPDSASDIFSTAAVSFILLGGDASQLEESIRRGTQRPRLPTNPFIPPAVEQAILSALHREPERRPRPSEVVQSFRRAASRPTPPAAARQAPPPLPTRATPGLQRLVPPPPGSERRIRAGNLDVTLSSLEILQGRQQSPLILPLSHVPGLLPAPVTVIGRSNGVLVELSEPAVAPKHRPGIYLNAHQPNTRCDSFLVGSTVDQTHFDVGHRKSWVQRIEVQCRIRAEAESALLLTMPDLGIEIEPSPLTEQLIAFRTAVPTSGAIHIALVMVRGPSL